MEAVIVVILALGVLSTSLKLGFHRPRWWWVWGAVVAVGTGLAWPLAATQSKTQLADFLQNPAMMGDAAVLLTLEVALMLAWCIADRQPADGRWRWLRRAARGMLAVFPGVVSLLALFSLLTHLTFSLTGTSFALISWSLAAAVLVAMPALTWLLRWLLPERELRLELLFMLNLGIGALGIVATVNGRTAVEGSASVDWLQLASVAALCLLGLAAGLLLRKRKTHKNL